jgi:hypothetical protein
MVGKTLKGFFPGTGRSGLHNKSVRVGKVALSIRGEIVNDKGNIAALNNVVQT